MPGAFGLEHSSRWAAAAAGAQCFFDALQCVMFDGTMNLSTEKGEREMNDFLWMYSGKCDKERLSAVQKITLDEFCESTREM